MTDKSKKNNKISRSMVLQLCKAFLEVITSSLNTVDHIAQQCTKLDANGKKYIDSSAFRLAIRAFKVRLMEDIQASRLLNPEDPDTPIKSDTKAITMDPKDPKTPIH